MEGKYRVIGVIFTGKQGRKALLFKAALNGIDVRDNLIQHGKVALLVSHFYQHQSVLIK